MGFRYGKKWICPLTFPRSSCLPMQLGRGSQARPICVRIYSEKESLWRCDGSLSEPCCRRTVSRSFVNEVEQVFFVLVSGPDLRRAWSHVSRCDTDEQQGCLHGSMGERLGKLARRFWRDVTTVHMAGSSGRSGTASHTVGAKAASLNLWWVVSCRDMPLLARGLCWVNEKTATTSVSKHHQHSVRALPTQCARCSWSTLCWRLCRTLFQPNAGHQR